MATIIDSRNVSLSEAAKLMRISEEEVFELTKYGFLSVAKVQNGRPMLSMNSIETYSRRSGLQLYYKATGRCNPRTGSYTISEVQTKLALKDEAAVHRLVQAGKLSARMEQGQYKVSAESLYSYTTGEVN
ncbi:hypothetical protein [Aneurinibacillus aneurinilyticus]|uniref:hypothetical protein n=1 Tax=Aneurinibacillus aneurinilyticus TaxID=1391 RepID=UPI00366F6EC6